MLIFLPECSPTPLQEIDDLTVFCLSEDLPCSRFDLENLDLVFFISELTNLSSSSLTLNVLQERKPLTTIKLHEQNHPNMRYQYQHEAEYSNQQMLQNVTCISFFILHFISQVFAKD